MVQVVVGTVVLVAAVQGLTAGYGFGYGEHTVLSLKGISWADRTALVNDWFNSSAPQPHVLFDVVTWFGESLGALGPVYLVYWLASLAVFAAANALLADSWLPAGLRSLQFPVLVLVVAGPYFALGTFLVIHGQAVPNALGGSLGFLAAVLILRRSWRAAVVASVVTTVVHIQHGTIVAFLLLVAFVLSPDRAGVRRFPYVIVGLAAIVFAVSLHRGLFVGNTDFAEICELASTGHCNPDVWPAAVVRGGVLLLAVGALAPFLAGRPDRVSVAVVAAPALVVAAGLAADLWELPLAADLSRRLFTYRFVMVVAPFAPWSIVLALARGVTVRPPGLVVAGVGLGVLWWWLNLPLAVLDRARDDVWRSAGEIMLAAATVATVAVVLAGVVLTGTRRPGRVPLAGALAAGGGAVLAVGVLAAGWPAVDHAQFAVSYREDDVMPVLMAELGRATPVGSVLVAPPDLSWFPLLTRRAVVATCKNIPYGGAPWRQYRQRLAALGVDGDYGRCAPDGYRSLRPEELMAMAPEFGASHVVVMPGDAAYDEVSSTWPVVHRTGGTMGWVVAEIPPGATS